MRTVLLALTLVLSACFPKWMTNPAEFQQEAMARAMGAPTHPPATEEEWKRLDAMAREQAGREAGTTLSEPVHLQGQGYAAEHRFQVLGGHCYTTAVAWTFPSETTAAVHFQARPDGALVNDFVGGASGRFGRDVGALDFCADRDGEALLTLSALTPQGAIAMNELLEYAVVIGARVETPEQAVARRGRDQQAGTDARARMEANIAAAKEREARNLEDRCRRCREDYRLCQVDSAAARRNPRPGVSYTQSCESKFYICATGKYSGTQEEMRQCGEPPR